MTSDVQISISGAASDQELSALHAAAADEARGHGCQWLHADYDREQVPF